MSPIGKLLVVILVLLILYSAVLVAIPYVRFYRVKSKMEEAVNAAVVESNESLARGLADVCLEQKVPIVGDFFYKVTDDQGKKFYYQPESEEERQQYLKGAKAYFLENIKRIPGQEIEISIEYTVEIYFPFDIYTLKKTFSHKEVLALSR